MSTKIRFLCPTCKAKMTASVEKAGDKINCLKCGQRLQIPPAERSKTVLAPSLGVESEPNAPASANSSPHIAVGQPPPPEPTQPMPTPPPQPPAETPRGWVLGTNSWLALVILASCLNFCADAGFSVGFIAKWKIPAPAGGPNPNAENAAPRIALGIGVRVVVMFIWLGVHWVLVWRRLIDVPFTMYRVWTGLHVAWTALALIGLVISLYLLSSVFTLMGQFPSNAQMPVPLQMALWLDVLSTGLNLLAACGWVAVVIAVPATQTEKLTCPETTQQAPQIIQTTTGHKRTHGTLLRMVLVVGALASLFCLAAAGVGAFFWVSTGRDVPPMADGIKDKKKDVPPMADGIKDKGQKPRPIQVSAAQLLRDYKDNEAKANNNYKGKMIRVTGIIQRVTEQYVMLKGNKDFAFMTVDCFLDREVIASLSSGSEITVIGNCDGMGFAGIKILECKLVK